MKFDLFSKRKVRKYVPRRLDTAPDVNSLRVSTTPFEKGTITKEDFECMVRHLANARDIMARARAASIGNKAYLNWHRQIQKVEDTLEVARYQRSMMPLAEAQKKIIILNARQGHYRYPRDEVDPDPASGE